jgi:hypothetical protein
MNRESLERLLIDRALGQLSPDVDELLTEQLAVNPDAGRTAEELTAVVALATAVIKRPPATGILPLPLSTLVRAERVTRIFAMAASFAVGAGFAAWVTRATTEPALQNVVSQTSPQLRAPARPPTVEHAIRTLPFWSNERIYVLASAAKQSNAEKQQP